MEGTFTLVLPPSEADVEEMKRVLEEEFEDKKWSLVAQEIAIKAEIHALIKFVEAYRHIGAYVGVELSPYLLRADSLQRLQNLVSADQISWAKRVEDIGDVFDRRLAIVQLHKRYLPIDICRILANGDDCWRSYLDGPSLEPYRVLDDELPVVPVDIHKCDHPGCTETFNTLRQLEKHARSHA
jgi:hypothetical protein